MSNPSLPPVPVAATASPHRRRARDPDDDDYVEDALEEGELRVPLPVGHESSDSDSTQDDDDGGGGGGGRRYLFQPRVEYDYAPEARRPQHHRSPRRRRPLNALDILLLGPGAGGALPYPTPSVECESDATLSDDDHHHGRGGDNPTGSSSSSAAGNSSAASAAADAVGRGWAATGKRGWKAGGRHRQVVLSHSDSDLKTISADGEAQAAPTAAHHHQQQPPLPQQAAQPPRAPRPRREQATEYTCKECGKSYTISQALGGHAAGHNNKQRQAVAMAAAMAAGGDASLAAAFPFPLGRSGGKADEPHECRKCGKVFASGVALGGHMRVHYTGPPIVPARKNKKRCLAPLPATEGDIAVAAPPVAAVGLSLVLSMKADEKIAVAPPVAAAGLSLALSTKTEEESPSTPPAAAPAGAAVRAVRLFGIDISPPQLQQAPLQQQQQGSRGTTTEGSSSTGQQQH